MKKITEQHIQELYKFTRAHYVEYFDVQTELVDHLANDIEAIWQEKPNLTFNEAKKISFKKFGVFGFQDVLAERQKALSKKYWKLIWSFAKNWFKLPKVILTALIFISFYTVFNSEYRGYFLFGTLILTFLCALYKGIIINKTLKNNFKQTGKKWMLEELIYKTGLGSFLLIPVNLVNLNNLIKFEYTTNTVNWVAAFYSAILTILVIVLYIALIILPKKANELLEKQYPEYKLVSKA